MKNNIKCVIILFLLFFCICVFFLVKSNIDNVDIDLFINSINVSKNSMTNKINVEGIVSLSYDSDKYIGATLSGYCLGDFDEKYLVHSVDLLDNNSEEVTFVENIPQNIEYSDGTFKDLTDINWENVKIKYCKIDKLIYVLKDGNEVVKEVAFSKNFNLD